MNTINRLECKWFYVHFHMPLCGDRLDNYLFLAATKQLYEWYFLSICPSVTPFDYVPTIISSWNFQELSRRTRVRSMIKVKVKGQGHRGHDPT